MTEHRRVLDCFGGRVAVCASGPGADGALVLAAVQLRSIHACLTRFDAGSELSRLNADPRLVVPASAVLLRLAAAVGWAGAVSGGLVDATLLEPLERAGYVDSRPRAERGAEQPALPPWGGPEAAAGPSPRAAWRAVGVLDAAVVRPPGVRLDPGGLGKGLAADLVAAGLAGQPTFAVDCGGDIRMGGAAGEARRVLVADPRGGAPLHELEVIAGAVATSGVTRSAWIGPDGQPKHHLIDPATGRPARTGVLQATALAPTALEAEVRAKAAVLAGARHGPRHLIHGGVLVPAHGAPVLVAADALERAA
jgi:thiamine biosynthesis lipoprotein